MQPPLANGSLLQNRFRIVKILGQGGCGRTYLATDEQRFDEYCAIKEYFPVQGHASAVQKSRELFQREAEILYQIQHSQIPQFRALFEEAERFFFAQDFVAGKSYHLLWQERLAQGKTFTEPEVIALFDRLLPILAYLHSQNIIHRDISLDNIMLRERDNLPVLIDFGVGKLTVEESQSGHFPYGTMVGKAGYSPIEQLKTGKVYPNSDLYALAVSAIVLLTGKAPADLFDEMTVNWQWRAHAPHTRQQLAQILDRMLAYRPQQRYQSAAEVLAQLDLINPQLQLVGAMAARSIDGARNAEIAAVSPNRAAGRSLTTIPPSAGFKHAPTTYRRQPQSIDNRSIGNLKSQPKLWRWGFGIILALGTISAIAIANAFKQSVPNQSPIVTAPNPSTVPQLLNPVNNTPLTVSGQVGGDGVRHYAIEGSPDRELSIRVISGAVRIHILHPDGQLPPGSPTILTAGNYFFPYAGKFLLDVKSTAATNFTFSVTLTPNSGSRRPPQPPDRSPEMNGSPPDRNLPPGERAPR